MADLILTFSIIFYDNDGKHWLSLHRFTRYAHLHVVLDRYWFNSGQVLLSLFIYGIGLRAAHMLKRNNVINWVDVW